jgi:hypothetical protein
MPIRWLLFPVCRVALGVRVWSACYFQHTPWSASLLAACKYLFLANCCVSELGVHRSDYMLDAPSGGFLQVSVSS